MEKTKIASLVASLVMGSQCDTVFIFTKSPVLTEKEDTLMFNTSGSTPSEVLLLNSEALRKKVLNNKTFNLKIELYIEGVSEPVVSVISFVDDKMIDVIESEFDVSFHV